jgi:hypothetical protein
MVSEAVLTDLRRRAPNVILTEPLQTVTSPKHRRATIAREGHSDFTILKMVRAEGHKAAA